MQDIYGYLVQCVQTKQCGKEISPLTRVFISIISAWISRFLYSACRQKSITTWPGGAEGVQGGESAGRGGGRATYAQD